MQEIVEALTAQHQELEELLVPLDDQAWATPTPRCPGWDVRDVVLHLAQTDEMALGSIGGRFTETLAALAAGLRATTSVDDGAGALVAAQRGAPPAEVHEHWREGAAALRQGFGAIDPSARVQWVVGDMAARTLATTRLAEAWIHTGDVRAAFGLPIVGSDRIRPIVRLAWRTLPYAFASAGRSLSGPVRFSLTSPGGEAWDFEPDDPAVTTITGPALDLCQVAGQRARAADTALSGAGPDTDAVLELVRTFA